MNRMSSGLNNLYNQANQAQALGNRQAPNLATVPDRTLLAASPGAVNLVRNTKINTTVSDEATEKCRTYSGIEGLRQLQRDQANRSALDSGCGWRYKPSSGLNPQINQAAIGTSKGPLFGAKGMPDEVSGGTKWYWDLQQAERDITANICKNVSKCKQLGLLGKYAEVCGYCKTTGAIIPVVKGRGNTYSARYPRDSTLQCEPGDLVTAGTGDCPKEEGFLAGSQDRRGLGVQGNLQEAFQIRGGGREGFQGLDDLDACTPPLTRDCVVLAARMAGCSDSGSLIQSLNAAQPGTDYDSVLQKRIAFTAYKQTANPSITSAVLKDGSAALTTALDDFGRLLKDTESPADKLRLSARDLCLQSGAFTGETNDEGFTTHGNNRGFALGFDANRMRSAVGEGFEGYNFCAEMTRTSLINESNILCVQNDWRKEGGTEKGTGFPQLSRWKNRTYQAYLDYTRDVFDRMRSTDKDINAAALQEFVGVDSFASVAGTVLPRDDTTRGGETVWIGIGNYLYGDTPVILRCDINLAKNGESLPVFSSAEELQAKYRVPSEGIAMTSAYELRPDATTDVALTVTSDDGFMVGFNQNPFEGTSSRNFDWGAWRFQAPTTYTSGNYRIAGVKEDTKNVFVHKWFQGGGWAGFNLRHIYKAIPQFPAYDNFKRYNTGDMVTQDGANYRFNQFIGAAGYGIGYPNVWTRVSAAPVDQVRDQSKSFAERTDIYLTQEPLAPWMQYEICQRPNGDQYNTTGFFEKRWNGPAGYVYVTNAKIPSFDVVAGSVVYQTDAQKRQGVPGGKPYASFTPSSWWHTKSYFAFNAFKTITVLVRPMAVPSNGMWQNIFGHINFRGLSIAVSITEAGNNQYDFVFWDGTRSNRMRAYPNEWNMIVLQYNSDEGGLRGTTCDVERLETLKTPAGRRAFLDRLRTKQSGGGSYLVGNAVSNRENSGYLLCGAGMQDYIGPSGKWEWKAPGFTGDIAWVHGFRTFLDTDELLKAEITQSWISRWPRANLDGEKNIGIDPKNYVMFGPWIGPGTPVNDVSYLPDGRLVFLIEQNPYTKMVTEDNREAKYYVGSSSQFDSSKWNSYSNATGNYFNRRVA